MPHVSVANLTSRGVLDFCRSRGIDTDDLLAAADIPPELVSVPGSRLSAEQALALWEKAARATGDPLITEHVISALPFGTYRVADYLMITGATPRDALQKFIRNFPLVNGAFQLHLSSSRVGAHLELTSGYPPEGPARFYVEFIFSMILSRLRLAAGVDWSPKDVCFVHPARARVDTYHPTFRCPTRFNQSANRMTLENHIADMALPSANALISEILDHYAQSLLKQSHKDDFLSDVRRVLGDGFSRGDIRLQTTARKLALSSRSLQRELQGRGTSYREQLDDLRRELALDLLTPTQILEVANFLQFSELSSFHRAFRRWTGKTPREYVRTKPS